MPYPFLALFPLMQAWLHGSLGIPGIVGLAVLLALLYCLQDWDGLEKRLFAGFGLGTGKLPKPDPEKLSIGVLLMENDDDREIGDVVAQALASFSGVHVARLDHTIGAHDPDWGRRRALELLRRSGFDAVIWGAVAKNGDKIVPTLYVTPAGASRRGKPRACALSPTISAFRSFPESRR